MRRTGSSGHAREKRNASASCRLDAGSLRQAQSAQWTRYLRTVIIVFPRLSGGMPLDQHNDCCGSGASLAERDDLQSRK